MRPSICVENVGKRYRIGSRKQGYETLREAVVNVARAPLRLLRRRPSRVQQDDDLWALRDVSFEVRPGETVGIIGRNGAGKSTLLKILSRITQPTTGSADLYGRVGSLLEVGTGFHPELTGRENIFLNGAILGMRRGEIAQKVDQIVAFAEVDQFIDTPVKRYSSGMYLRLAFAVAAHLEPEILLVDEVLAVGDTFFQRKCLARISEVAGEGRTVLFVSHNMAAVTQLCSRGMLLERGRMKYDGGVEQAIAQYHASGTSAVDGVVRDLPRGTGDGRIRIRRLSILNGRDEPWIQSGDTVRIRMDLDAAAPVSMAHVKVGVGINGAFGERLLTLINEFDPAVRNSTFVLTDGASVTCEIERLLMRAGTYTLDLYIDISGDIASRVKDAVLLEVQESDFYKTGETPAFNHGPMLAEQKWYYREPA